MAKYCWNCGAKLGRNAETCSKCGAQIQSVRRICPHCGNAVGGENAVYCCKCGKRIRNHNNGMNMWIIAACLVIAAVTVIMLLIKGHANRPVTPSERYEMLPVSTAAETQNIAMASEPEDTIKPAVRATEPVVTESQVDKIESVEGINEIALPAEAKAASISILENYQEEYGEYIDDYYPDGNAAILADLDGDGTEELVLNEWPCTGDEDHDGYPDQVMTYCVYDYQDSEWKLCVEPQVIGSVSFAGSAGHSFLVYKDGQPVLATYEWRAPYGTGWFPGEVDYDTVTLYDQAYRPMETFEIKTTMAGDYGNIEFILTYKVNETNVSRDQFAQRLSKYQGMELDEESGYVDTTGSGLTVEELLAKLR